MTEEINYEALFNQLRKENECLRIDIIKLKNDEYPFFDRIKDKLSDLLESPYAMLYIYAAFMVLVFIIQPIIQAVFNYIFRRNTDER